jgi:hypothetical protein
MYLFGVKQLAFLQTKETWQTIQNKKIVVQIIDDNI